MLNRKNAHFQNSITTSVVAELEHENPFIEAEFVEL